MELLLLSNSRTAAGFLTDYLTEIADFAGAARSALFVPFASVARPWDEFAAMVGEALAPKGIAVESLAKPEDAAQAKLFIVGGGNTFQLLRECRARGLLDPIRQAVKKGARYIGWSASACC